MSIQSVFYNLRSEVQQVAVQLQLRLLIVPRTNVKFKWTNWNVKFKSECKFSRINGTNNFHLISNAINPFPPADKRIALVRLMCDLCAFFFSFFCSSKLCGWYIVVSVSMRVNHDLMKYVCSLWCWNSLCKRSLWKPTSAQNAITIKEKKAKTR